MTEDNYLEDIYEAHITIDAHPSEVSYLEKFCTTDTYWKFSKIDGDPVLGNGVKVYFTAHAKDIAGYLLLKAQMKIVSKAFSVYKLYMNSKIVRMKIEKICFDVRGKDLEFFLRDSK